MAKKTSVTLYDNGQIVGSYDDVQDIRYGQDKTLFFKVKEKSLSTQGPQHDRVITRSFTTTLHAIIEEVVEHSGLFSV